MEYNAGCLISSDGVSFDHSTALCRAVMDTGGRIRHKIILPKVMSTSHIVADITRVCHGQEKPWFRVFARNGFHLLFTMATGFWFTENFTCEETEEIMKTLDVSK